ncbi:MAG: MBL fold metallo-hydrolase [Cyanophyceae cyanobacterium]
MKRRKLMQYAGASVLSALGTAGMSSDTSAQTPGAVTVQWLGHSSFLFTGNGLRILVNPFQTLGCTAGYRPPRVEADVVLVSSWLLDEGAAEGLPGNPRVLYEPGIFSLGGIRLQGIATPHDREGGRRFGTNVVWLWTQGGINILHLGGAAAPIELEQKILMGSPDLALIPVGGGPKNYNPQEAQQAMEVLQPKLVIPTQYLTEAANKETCDLAPVEEFLAATENIPVERLGGDTLTLTQGELPADGPLIRVLSYQYS